MDIQTQKTVADPITGSEETVRTSQVVPTEQAIAEGQAIQTNAWIWYVVGVINILLLLRFIFLLLGAGNAGFTSFLYSVTGPFVAPFKGIFQAGSLADGYFDSASILAIVIYSLIGWGVSALVDVIKRPTA